MSIYSPKQGQTRKKPEEVVQLLADKYDVSKRYVQMVINGSRLNEQILADYLEYRQQHNRLLEAVRTLVPFN